MRRLPRLESEALPLFTSGTGVRAAVSNADVSNDDTPTLRNTNSRTADASLVSSAEAVDQAVVALSSGLIAYPMACEQMAPDRQIECADAYLKTTPLPPKENEKKRIERP